MKCKLLVVICLMMAVSMNAQNPLKKVYDTKVNPLEQIDQAVVKAKGEGKHVICQVGGNWCIWCLRFADFMSKDSVITQMVNDNFVYIHVNYSPRKSQGEEKLAQGRALMKRLNNAGRFGFPVMVVLDEEGKVIHIQDSGYLEEKDGYNRKKVIDFFKNWTPKAVRQLK